MNKKELNLLTKILTRYSKYYEFKVIKDIVKGFSINFYDISTNELEKQAFMDLSKDYFVEFSKKDKFDKGTRIPLN